MTEFLDAVSTAFGEDRFSRTWFREETGSLALVVGIVDPTDADMQLLAALSAGDDTIGLPPVIVQDVPIGLAGLLANQSVVDSILAEA